MFDLILRPLELQVTSNENYTIIVFHLYIFVIMKCLFVQLNLIETIHNIGHANNSLKSFVIKYILWNIGLISSIIVDK